MLVLYRIYNFESKLDIIEYKLLTCIKNSIKFSYIKFI